MSSDVQREDVTATERERPWLLHLICCGRDDGTWPCSTWEEADEIRRSYIEAEGHDRSAIITTRGVERFAAEGARSITEGGRKAALVEFGRSLGIADDEWIGRQQPRRPPMADRTTEVRVPSRVPTADLDLSEPRELLAFMLRRGLFPNQMAAYEDPELGWVDPLDDEDTRAEVRAFIGRIWRTATWGFPNGRRAEVTLADPIIDDDPLLWWGPPSDEQPATTTEATDG